MKEKSFTLEFAYSTGKIRVSDLSDKSILDSGILMDIYADNNRLLLNRPIITFKNHYQKLNSAIVFDLKSIGIDSFEIMKVLLKNIPDSSFDNINCDFDHT